MNLRVILLQRNRCAASAAWRKNRPFMELFAKHDDMLLPIKPLLRIINETHRKDLAIGED